MVTNPRPFEVLEGGKPPRNDPGFVCPWCGQAFKRRYVASDGVMSLQEHFETNPRCKRNQNVNNPTQEKNMIFDEDTEI